MKRSNELASDSNPLAFLLGGGEMGRLIRSMDWSETSLGPVAGWPQSLRTTVSICLASDLPICVIWGQGLVQLYNDAYRVICGDKHPRSMGQNFSECWKEAWPVIGEAHDSALGAVVEKYALAQLSVPLVAVKSLPEKLLAGVTRRPQAPLAL